MADLGDKILEMMKFEFKEGSDENIYMKNSKVFDYQKFKTEVVNNILEPKEDV